MIHRYRAGMPQLSYTGLSENWLLKECGHRHWEALAAHAGRQQTDFHDDNGGRSYAAFTAIRLQTCGLDAVAEHDAFDIDSTLCRTGPVRHFSTHRIVRGGTQIAELSMSSAFVTRGDALSNRRVARAALAGLTGDVVPMPERALQMTQMSKRLRASDRAALPDLAPATSEPIEFLPCPNSDFNGADFLYFASFQAFVDRAEWQWRRDDEPPVVASRSLFYYGNVDVGDTLSVRMIGRSEDAQGLRHWTEVRRKSDGMKIADVTTEKRWRCR
ncbi:Pnap_2097 family protein [Paraburkholderia sp. Tr-20389]|uniref:Pnap_2097 family protein n=1 Tax=Paraburkholderia sp. Tr-20389 TaxID=2703903 RepID=UPI001980994A|nr:Pnap_2097 family protein [Paraburkholderia sp. Tr-20389]